MGHNGASKIQKRMSRVGQLLSLVWMWGLPLTAPERKVIKGSHLLTNLPGFSVSLTFSRVKSLPSVRLSLAGVTRQTQLSDS